MLHKIHVYIAMNALDTTNNCMNKGENSEQRKLNNFLQRTIFDTSQILPQSIIR